jgi:hypothetical protein
MGIPALSLLISPTFGNAWLGQEDSNLKMVNWEVRTGSLTFGQLSNNLAQN